MLTILKNCLIFLCKSFFTYVKTDDNSSARYCQKIKERLQKKTHERYQNVSEEEKIKSHIGRERYKNLSEYEKQRLIDYRKNYSKMRRNTSQ